ncbi:amidohydrolase family protein [Salegentibacter salegens]|uniref:Cytosine/adenosine deaminase n=1 Tax=Salegentibacter salegens TaxID=143223 RepID=A0A1M7IXY2_9FLAO|nr:amidohydrolase family protein [Salegentibacter salegens]PRX49849.1 cytosine/adenosine deaminase-related metal-dependent hydrolase [Salegentibacter salegens]SHM45558.1 Cytosine/adenosine deaminase [Salegentibacter salegens]
MNKENRRDFLKKTGLVGIGSFINPFSVFSENQRKFNKFQQNSYLIKNATILSMDDEIGDLASADILIKDGKIAKLGNQIEIPPGTETINAEGGILIPGLIDCHWHLWTSLLRSMAGDSAEEGYFKMTARFSRLYTPEDMELAANYAIAEAIYSGITCISDYNHNARSPEFVKASFDAMTNMGIRGHVSYGTYRDMPGSTPTDFKGINELKQLINLNSKYKDISLGLGSRSANYQNIEKDWERARELGLQITIHASSNESQKDQIASLFRKNLLAEDVNIIHGNAITPDEVKMVENTGASLTMTPYSEMRIGYGLPKINELYESKINCCVGIDTTALTGNAHLLDSLKLLQNLANANAKNEFYLHPKEVLKMATINGAKNLGIDKETGSITPGKSADLVLLKKSDINFSTGNKPYHLAIEAALPENMKLVMAKGKILKYDEQLTSIDTNNLIEQAKNRFAEMEKEIK